MTAARVRNRNLHRAILDARRWLRILTRHGYGGAVLVDGRDGRTWIIDPASGTVGRR